MSELDDRIREGLERLAPRADGSGAIDDVARRKLRYRTARRARAGALAVAVVLGSAAGVWALNRAFNLEQTRPAVPAGRNGLIAFSAQTENGWDILVVNPDGTGLRPLVAGLHDDIHPVWSPNGTRLAFVTRRERMSLLHVVDADGSGKQDLYAIRDGEISSPAWSPNGENIAVIDSNGVLVVPRTSSSVGTPYGAPATGVSGGPDWSPDGSMLAMEDQDGGLLLWDIAGEQPLPVSLPNTRESRGCDDVSACAEGWVVRASVPAWSPDGRSIIFSNVQHGEGRDGCGWADPSEADNSPARGIHRLDVESGQLERLTTGSCDRKPTWSPDGSKIAFVGGDEPVPVVTVLAVDAPENPLVAIKVEGDIPAIAWSPDGSLAAYSTQDSIRVAPIGQGSREVVSGVGTVGDISWQPVPGPVIGPTPGPTPSATMEPTGCPAEGEPLPETYDPIERQKEADLRGDGRLARVRIVGDEDRPRRCRYFLVVEDPSATFRAVVPVADWIFDTPTLLMTPEIDGEPGREIVVAFGGPGHPHRTGVVYTFHEGTVVAMRFADSQPPPPSTYVDLGGEFAVGVDCAGEPGTIVTTWGVFAGGGEDDSRFDITRIFYRAVGAVWEEIDREMPTVEVGTERERWPEIADDPFRSCQR